MAQSEDLQKYIGLANLRKQPVDEKVSSSCRKNWRGGIVLCLYRSNWLMPATGWGKEVMGHLTELLLSLWMAGQGEDAQNVMGQGGSLYKAFRTQCWQPSLHQWVTVTGQEEADDYGNLWLRNRRIIIRKKNTMTQWCKSTELRILENFKSVLILMYAVVRFNYYLSVIKMIMMPIF